MAGEGLSEKMTFKPRAEWQQGASPVEPGGENSRAREQLESQLWAGRGSVCGGFKDIMGPGPQDFQHNEQGGKEGSDGVRQVGRGRITLSAISQGKGFEFYSK